MWQGFRNWLNNAPIGNPIERRQAPMLQIMLIGIMIAASLALLNILVAPVTTQRRLLGIAVNTLYIVSAASGLAALRRGHFRLSVLVPTLVSALILGMFLIAVGLRNGAPFLIVFTIPIILAGLLAGRPSSFLIIGIGIATMLLTLTLERVAPRLIGFVPVGDSTSTVVVVFVLVTSVSGLFLDRFGHTLSTTLNEALARERELEHSRAALELRTSELEREIGERTKAETAQRRLNDELEVRVAARTAALEAANKELEAFSYSVSHDLRAPLRAIDGFARILREDYTASLPDEAQQYFGYIRENAQRMNNLVDDLLAFSRLSRQPLTKGSVDVAELVRQCLDELHAEQVERQLTIRVGELPACAGDRALLKQVWFNLLSNALKYTRKRDVAEITVGSQRQGDDTVYFVQDNGAGFDMRYSDKLFGVFQRLHRAEEYEGTGVGLANVQRIVVRHGGRIWAEAAVEQGATFFFTLGSERA